MRSMLTRFVDFLKTLNITVLFTAAITVGSIERNPSDEGISSMVDTWMMVQDIEVDAERTRSLCVMKSRGDFIHSMLEEAGFENVFKDRVRYPVVSLDDIAIRKPGWILLASEPFPFKEKHIEEMKAHLPGTKFLLADGEMFSWYGSRMIHAPSYFLNLWQYGIHGK
ncbi:MAG: helical backbone metal receptor [Bacteroidota bacterium]